MHGKTAFALFHINNGSAFRNNKVDRFYFEQGRIYINHTQFFEIHDAAIWDMYIAGYQPLQKWLKDRRGEILTSVDIDHYKQMVQALIGTKRIMKEIDEVIEL